MSQKFKRTIEDFICEQCGASVKGNGYTNHCPHCLWSKHVDINPGDRENTCQGLMEPVAAFLKGPDWYITHRCQKCNQKAVIRLRPEDNIEVIKELFNRN